MVTYSFGLSRFCACPPSHEQSLVVSRSFRPEVRGSGRDGVRLGGLLGVVLKLSFKYLIKTILIDPILSRIDNLE